MRVHFVGLGAGGCRILDALSGRVGDWRCVAGAVGVCFPDVAPPAAGVDRHTVTRREVTDFAGGLERRDLLGDASYFDRLRARDGTTIADGVEPSAPPEGIVVVADCTTRVGTVVAGPLLAHLGAHDTPVYLVALSDRTLSHVSQTARQAADATIGIDIDAWIDAAAETPADDPQFPDTIATRLQATFCHVSPTHHPQRVIDAGDVKRVLGTEGALVSVGYAEEQLANASSSLFGLDVFDSTGEYDVAELSHAIQTVTRKALHGSQTLPTQTQTCRRGLFVIGGPPEWLLHTQVTESRGDVVETLDADLLLGGDVPVVGSDRLFAAIVRAGVVPDGE